MGITDVLKYHVVAGAAVYSNALGRFQEVETLQGQDVAVRKTRRDVTINNAATVVLADVKSSNGVVHIIDSVLMPPQSNGASISPSIVENAIATPMLSTLVSVLTMPAYKPILDALSGNGPFTVFAPSNAAFASAGVDVNNVAAVTDVLKYHVVAGAAVYSNALGRFQEVETL